MRNGATTKAILGLVQKQLRREVKHAAAGKHVVSLKKQRALDGTILDDVAGEIRRDGGPRARVDIDTLVTKTMEQLEAMSAAVNQSSGSGKNHISQRELYLVGEKNGDAGKRFIRAYELLTGRTIDTKELQRRSRLSHDLVVSSDSGLLRAISSAIRARKFGNIDSMLIMKEGKVAWEEYYGGYSKTDLHTLQSATKSVTSILVGIAVAKGLIPSLDVSVHEIFKDSKYASLMSPDLKKVPLRHVLGMTANLDWSEAGDFKDIMALNDSDDWIGYVLSKGLKGKPGGTFYYNSGLSVLLSGIMQHYTKMSLDEFAERHLFSPLGIKEYDWTKQGEIAHSGGGLFLRPDDFMKLGQLMMNDGVWNGARLLTSDWVKQSMSPLTPTDFASTMGMTDPDSNYRYGYQWWVQKVPYKGRLVDVHSAEGYGGQLLLMIPAANAIVAFTGWNEDEKFFAPFGIIEDLLKDL